MSAPKNPRRRSRRTLHRLALHYAIAERDSFAEAYGEDSNDDAATRARQLAADFRRCLFEEFGEITSEDALATGPGRFISIHEVARRATTGNSES